MFLHKRVVVQLLSGGDKSKYDFDSSDGKVLLDGTAYRIYDDLNDNIRTMRVHQLVNDEAMSFDITIPMIQPKFIVDSDKTTDVINVFIDDILVLNGSVEVAYPSILDTTDRTYLYEVEDCMCTRFALTTPKQ
jgi:hypothetical protein